MGIELKTKQGNITLVAPKGGGGSIDLSNYYTKAQTDEKISEAVANIDIPEVDFAGYATEDYVDETFVTKEDWETIIPSFLTDIPDEYLTEDEANELYAKAADIPDVSEFQTEAQVIALIAEYGGGTLPASEDGEF